mmetsp:Transcript_3647/g.7539  ORF Transcript_3647/g.7539 Transcript_3647/m.7539 type:complete len:121 (-) Transcript_3647:447-809(-)
MERCTEGPSLEEKFLGKVPHATATEAFTKGASARSKGRERKVSTPGSRNSDPQGEVQFAIDLTADPSDLSKASPHGDKKIIEDIAHLHTPTCLKSKSVKDDDISIHQVLKLIQEAFRGHT